MFKVFACLTGEHDYRLVVLAAVVAVLASSTAASLLRRLKWVDGGRREVGMVVASIITGIGVWATHFIAMLAFRPGVEVGYDLSMTIVSLLAVIALIWTGFSIALAKGIWGCRALGGATVGLAIGVMHYLGMAAFEVQGSIVWDKALIWASLVMGVGFGAAALRVALGPRGGGLVRHAAAAALLALAICGLHFTAMGAAVVLPDPSVLAPPHEAPARVLAVWVACGAGALLLLSAAALWIAHLQRRDERRRRQDLANASVEGLVVCDGSLVMTANAAFANLAGATEKALEGQVFAALFDGAAVAERLAAARLRPEETDSFEAWLLAADGERIPVEIIARMLSNDNRLQQAVAVRDLRARNAADAQIRFLAHHDVLTGLENRASFNARLDRELENHRRKDDSFAVMCLDLDRFKQINDAFGHAGGDTVLKVVSQRIRDLLDSRDVFARLGGDELAIIRLGPRRVADLAALGERIIAATTPPIPVEGGEARVGVSIGIALFPADGAAAADLMRNADAALYTAKSEGRLAYRFFEPAIGQDMRNRRGLEADLRHALSRGEFSLVYQPLTALKTGETFGFEALLRWTHPVRGVVTPAAFLPIAEETGLIVPIGEWVMRQACAEAARWPKPLQIAVNLSGVQLHASQLTAMIERVLADTGLDPRRLELEIPETALVSDFDTVLGSLRRLKAMGIKIAMDDFGTGFSSLASLRAFPFDKIKIDESFVRDVDSNPQAATVVRAIVGLARGMNMTVVAEGVETAGELSFLHDECCAEAQGHLFGRPGAIGDFASAFAATPQSLAAARLKRRA